jgi:Mn2+/Fe2+ NRAMP family transporter
LAKPDWGAVLKATVLPTFTWHADFVSLVIATVGTTIAPWTAFFVQSNMVDKGATVDDLKIQRWDVVGGAISANVVAWFIIMTTATVLFPAGIKATDAGQAAMALGPLAGKFATILFAVGLFGASMLAAAVLPLTAAYAICEAFGWEAGVDRSWAEAPAFNGIFTFVIAFGAAIILLPGIDLVGVMIFSQVINGVLLPFLLIFMIILVNDRKIMGAHVNGRIYNILAWVTIIVVLALTVALLVITALGVA